jgi:hypothetical protein
VHAHSHSCVDVDECAVHNDCSVNATCVNTDSGYLCQCKPNFIDLSPNPRQRAGLVCKAIVNECASPTLNDCHPNAICIDTASSFSCRCKPDFIDTDELRNPGRNCVKSELSAACVFMHSHRTNRPMLGANGMRNASAVLARR